LTTHIQEINHTGNQEGVAKGCMGGFFLERIVVHHKAAVHQAPTVQAGNKKAH
jgi:hypothetical protein